MKIKATKYLIPEDSGIAEGIDDVTFLGKATIRGLIQTWRSKAKNTSYQIKYTKEKLVLLRGDTSISDNICGRCQQAFAYTSDKTFICWVEIYAGIGENKRKFDSPCFLKGASDIDQVRRALKKKIHSFLKEKKKIDQRIKTLLILEKQVEEKPILPRQRHCLWFDIGDSVVLYSEKSDWRIIDDKFLTAKVIDGFRYHDGMVALHYDQRVHEGEYLDGYGGSIGDQRPELMQLWEYEYFLKCPDFANFWARNCSSYEGFNGEKFLEALEKERNKRKN